MIGTSSIIILDEPTANLDIQARLKVWQAIKKIKEGRTLILSTQIVEEAEFLCDMVCFMKSGQILQIDSPQALKDSIGFHYRVDLRPLSDDLDAKLGFLQLSPNF